MLFETAVIALTMNLYMEARGEQEQCMRLVADTVINRTVLKDKSHFDVIMTPKHYSWANKMTNRKPTGLFELQAATLSSVSFTGKNFEAYKRAEKIAREVLSEGYRPKNRYTHFHTLNTRPSWSLGKKRIRCGGHYFYANIAM